MTFQRVGMKQQYLTHDMRKKIIELAEKEAAKPPMSRKRFIGTFLSLISGVFMVYCSIFYVPAYIDLGNALGMSADGQKLPAVNTDTETRHALSAYTDKFKIRRGYMRAGQALEIKYALFPGTKMTVKIEKCQSPPIIEVFYCQQRHGEEVVIQTPRGARSFIIREPGFYYFDETVTTMDGQPTTMPSNVIWKRVMKKAPPEDGASLALR